MVLSVPCYVVLARILLQPTVNFITPFVSSRVFADALLAFIVERRDNSLRQFRVEREIAILERKRIRAAFKINIQERF